MFTYLSSVLAGLAPRRAPTAAPPPRLFRRGPVFQRFRDLAVSRDGTTWLAGDAGLLDLGRGALLTLPEGDLEGAGLEHVGGWGFVAAGGPGGLFVVAGGRLSPVEPREAVEALCGTPWGVAAATRDPRGIRHLRFAGGPEEAWHELYRPSGRVRALAPAPGERLWLAGAEGLLEVDPWGRARTLELPAGCREPATLVSLGARLLLGDLAGSCWLREAPGAAWVPLGEGLPGEGPEGLALGTSGGVVHVGPGGSRRADGRELPPQPAGGTPRPVGVDPEGGALALAEGVLLRGARRRWRPRLLAGLAPPRVGALRRTRAGALWVADLAGRLFHRDPAGVWSALDLPEDLRATGAVLGCDGEALLMPAWDPGRAFRPQESLFWVAPPRGDEAGARVARRPDPVSLGPRTGEPVTAVVALGADVFAGVGGRLVRSRAGAVEVWGPEQGVPGGPVVALETLFDDLWLVPLGARGPLRFAQGTPGPDPVPDDGPRGRATALVADEDSGQLWVGFEDGEKGGAASLSREGRWISQLRLPAPVRGLAAAGGTMAVAAGGGLFLLEEGARQRQALGSGAGLPDGGAGLVALSAGQLLVDTPAGVYLSDLEAWRPPEPEDMQV